MFKFTLSKTHNYSSLLDDLKSLYSRLKLDDLKIEKVNGLIFYYGLVEQGLNVVGFIESLQATGEEYLILTDKSKTSKGENFVKFSTRLNLKDFKSDYFSKSMIQELIRIKVS